MSAKRIAFFSSKELTGSGQSATMDLPTITMGELMLVLGAPSGTSPTFDGWLEVSTDGGNNYTPVPYDMQLTDNGTGTDQTANTAKRNVNGTSSATGAGTHVARYNYLPAGKYRFAYVIGGTSPSWPVTAVMEGK